uniref:Single-strand selective monofunctional uracil DNA glycosylase n=1 Tax=Timema cristinae TaxID=61476 RepID=A0A7R9CMG6_TIMCR|nr:unnamed protein product [Timema cristinae]
MSFTPSNEISLSDQFLTIELQLSTQMKALRYNQHVAYIYDPVEYAYNLHAQFTRKFCQSAKKILFLGMNPGPWGMSQTGVPFGEVKVVRDWMRLSGEVGHPIKEHPSRPVLGLACHRSEISGRKFWGLFQELCKEPQHFFQHAFVYNYCPLAFLSSSGKNITPAEFKEMERRRLEKFDWLEMVTNGGADGSISDCNYMSSKSIGDQGGEGSGRDETSKRIEACRSLLKLRWHDDNRTCALTSQADERKLMNQICDEALCKIITLLQVQMIIGLGKFAEKRASLAIKEYQLDNIKVHKRVVSIPHPSPRNFMVKDWNQEATLQLIRLQIIDCFTPSSNST